ncbi:MAG: hypothetical protein CMN28_01585 [Salinisphaeraceae bacterium]|nr:hypothetical protein [Salinisphaeraceae bacterium]
MLGLLEAALLPASNPDEVLSSALHEGDVSVTDRLERIAEVASAMPSPAVIFLDNISYCQDETLGPVLDILVFNTPSWVHLVTSGVSEPPLQRSRLMLQGDLLEIGYDDLKLGESEVRALFGRDLASALGADGLDRALDLTEGWPAALRMTQIRLSQEGRPADVLAELSGSNRELAGLLNEQLLESFSHGLQAFLMKIAPLERFEASLCEAVTENGEARAFIDELVRRNALVIPLDREGRWYRLHGLLRDHVVDLARRELSDAQFAELMVRAAVWFESQSLWSEAVQYALAGGAATHAAALLERVAALIVRDRGNLKTFIEWVESLLAANAEVGQETRYWYVWALIFHRRYEYARSQLKHLQMLDGEVEPPREFERRLAVIDMSLHVYTDRNENARELAAEWLESQQPDDDPFDVATVATAAAILACAENEFGTARRYMQTARSAIGQSDSEYGVAWVYLLSSMIPASEGDFALASKDLKACLTRADRQLGDTAGITGSIALVYAKCAVMMGDTELAGRLLERGLRKFDSHGIVETAACGLQAGVLLWRGQDDDRIAIGELRELADNYPPRLAFLFSCFLVQRLLQLDRVEEAELEARQAQIGEEDMPAVTERFGERARSIARMTLIDLAIAQGHLRAAARQVEAETAIAKKQSRWEHLVELALADMTIAICSHNQAPAARHLIRAISLAARRDIYRPFHDRKTMLAGLVNETKPQSWGFANEEERRFFGSICKGLPIENSALLEQLQIDMDDAALLQTPTPRELELISLIEAGLTNQQIADRLSVSVATVKWHLYNLYGKLGVSNRSAALARARALNLLSR